jgi:uncharacterized protein (TIRG00374 family)
MIPLLPGGLVTVDAAYLSIFSLFDIPISVGVSAVLIERAISYVMGTIAGSVALSYLGVKRPK